MVFRPRLFSRPLRERYPVRKAGSYLISDRHFAKLAFLQDHGRLPQSPPVTFNERISDLIGSGASGRYEAYCDKLAVRDLVARKIGSKYLVPLHATADKLTADLWDRLPESFMLKPSHGSGWFWLIRNKSTEKFGEVSTVAANWLRMNYYYYYRERQYRNIRPVLLFEHVLSGGQGGEAPEYKFFCFHGKARMVYALFQRGLKRRLLYDMDWNKLNVRYKDPNVGHAPRPAALEEMRSIAETMAQGFDFVRVDLYSAAEGVFFGELTFTPLIGSDPFDPPEFDAFLGGLWAGGAGDMAQWREAREPLPMAVGQD